MSARGFHVQFDFTSHRRRGAGTEEVQVDSCMMAVNTVHLYLRGEGIGDSVEVRPEHFGARI